MNKNAKPAVTSSKDSLFALIRFVASLIVLLLLAVADLVVERGEVPTVVYMLVGALNGVDGYKLFKEVQKS